MEPRLDNDAFGGLIDQIYSGVTEQSAWQTFLDTLTELVSASAGGIHTINTARPRGEAVIARRFDPSFVQSYERYYSTVNPRVIHGGHLLKEGNVVVSGMQYSDDRMLLTEFYSDWLAPQNLFHSAGVVILDDQHVTSNLTIFRSKSSGEFNDAEQKLLRDLYPHLRRAVKLRRQLVTSETEKRTTIEALDRIAIPVILLNLRGKIVLTNRSGSELLRHGDTLRSTPSGIAAANPREDRPLKRLIETAIRSRIDTSVVGGGSIHLSRPQGDPVTVMVIPFVGNRDDFEELPAVGLYVSDSNTRGAGTAAYERMFGFTPAEARVAALIAQGKTMEQAADELHLSSNTIRSHMKAIFHKAGVNRQPDLVRLLISTPRLSD